MLACGQIDFLRFEVLILTPSARWLKSLVAKAQLHNKQLSTAHKATALAHQKVAEVRNRQKGTISKKFVEVCGYKTRIRVARAERNA